MPIQTTYSTLPALLAQKLNLKHITSTIQPNPLQYFTHCHNTHKNTRGTITFTSSTVKSRLLPPLPPHLARVYDAVQIRVHELWHDVHVIEVSQWWRGQDVDNLDYVHVVQTAEKAHLPNDAFRIHHIIEGGRDLLDCNLDTGIFIIYSPPVREAK